MRPMRELRQSYAELVQALTEQRDRNARAAAAFIDQAQETADRAAKAECYAAAQAHGTLALIYQGQIDAAVKP